MSTLTPREQAAIARAAEVNASEQAEPRYDSRLVSRVITAALVLAIFLAGIGVAVIGIAWTTPNTVGSPQSYATGCLVKAVPGHQDATFVPSGDAGNYWLPGASGYRTMVCTDGTLVPVARYGSTATLASIARITSGHAPGWAHLEAVPAKARSFYRLGSQRAVMLVTPRETFVITFSGKVFRS